MKNYEKLWNAIVSKQEKASFRLYCNLLEGHTVLYSKASAEKYGQRGRSYKFQSEVWQALEKDYTELERPEKVKEYRMLRLRTERKLTKKNHK